MLLLHDIRFCNEEEPTTTFPRFPTAAGIADNTTNCIFMS